MADENLGVTGSVTGSVAGRWDSALLLPIVEINELLLETLRAAASSSSAPQPRLVADLRQSWCELDDAAQQRLARCPYLLLDAHFGCAKRWEPGGVMDGAGPQGYFTSPPGVALVRRALVFAWHLARSNRLTARVLLGMSPECADRIAASALRQLEALAELCPAWIVPRWESQPLVWRQMIQGARAGRDASLRQVQLRGLQLLAGSMW